MRYRLLPILMLEVLVSAQIQQQTEERSRDHYVRRAQEELPYDNGIGIQDGYINRLTEDQGIVGGTQASEGEFPWFVAFDPLVMCGGSLIAPDRVLTAAHCVVGGPPSSVLVGPTNINDGEQIDVLCASYHPDFRVGIRGDLFNDIAVLKLASNSTAQPVTLNSDINYPSVEGTPLTVIGYGATAEGGIASSALKKLGTFFQTTSTCQKNYPDVEFGTHVCGNVDDSGDCQGDSGGPLFDTNKTQVGIVSYGFGCARSEEDVYAGVAKYYDWIQQEINSDECTVQTVSLLDRIINFLVSLSSMWIWFQSLSARMRRSVWFQCSGSEQGMCRCPNGDSDSGSPNE